MDDLSQPNESRPLGHDRRLVFCLLSIPIMQSIANFYLGGQNLYGMGHYLINYHFGFVRRGLMGQLLSGISFLSLHRLCVISTIATALCIATPFFVFLPAWARDRRRAALFAFLLSGPGLLPHSAYEAGFLDNPQFILITLAAGALTWWRGWSAILASTLLGIVGILIHEAFLLMYYPLIFVLVIEGLREGRLRPLSVALHLTAVGVAFVLIAWLGKLPVPASEFFDYMQSRTDMELMPDAIRALENSTVDQLNFVLQNYNARHVTGVLVSMLTSLPYFVAIGLFLRMTARARAAQGLGAGLTSTILCSSILLSIVGHDVLRWVSAACANVSLYVICDELRRARNPAARDEVESPVSFVDSRWFAVLFAYILVLGGFGIAGNRLVHKMAMIFEILRGAVPYT